MQVFANKTVLLDGKIVGRIDQDSFQMLTHIRGKTVFFTGEPHNLNTPHRIDVPLYVPATTGSVSAWKINPDFEAAVRKIVA